MCEFGRISDICDKVNFTTNYTHFTTPDIHFILTHTIFYQNIHKYYNFLSNARDTTNFTTKYLQTDMVSYMNITHQ